VQVVNAIAPCLLRWFDQHGRHDLPWQHPRTPYRVWLSEIMLQQTQVITVIGYFPRFIRELPDLPALANASQDQVLALWSGLGYYSRARNLHRAAQICRQQHAGELPQTLDELIVLPGIGRSTAAAILAQAHGQRVAILDGNVKRVLSRYVGVHGWPGSTAVEKSLWELAEKYTPPRRVADYTQAIMDLGASVCTRSKPRCGECPLAANCIALRDDLTAQLPQRKATRVSPQRATTMLIIRDVHDRILLQRRPPSGIWAALWSLPQVDAADAAQVWLGNELGIARGDASDWQTLPQFIHTFSHFQLAISPLLLQLKTSPTRISDGDDIRWCSHRDIAALGLPAPVRKLLLSIWE
jgi:A/G-specific adenine glycosylase